MPLPVLIVGGVGVALSAYVMWRLRRKKYLLAVLGARFTGKTTLIDSWRGTWVDGDPGRTQTPDKPSKTKLTVEGLRLTFTVGDVSGDSNSWSSWQDRVNESRYLLYLVDARMLADRPMPTDRNADRVRDDVGLIGRHWLTESPVHLTLLVVTHTDEDPRGSADGTVTAEYRKLVTDQLRHHTMLLGGDAKVRVAVGSLKDQNCADRLTQEIVRHIVVFEKDYKP